VIDSQLRPERRRYVVVSSLRFRDLPATPVTIALRCVRRCALTERLRKRRGPNVIASRRFEGKRLSSGATIEARIVGADRIGSVRRYRVHAGRIVRVAGSTRCIPIGARKARRTCDGGR